ncbi:GldG family protein [Falsiroseomonas selenitidurans]|uniref:GldG family protein n=1 Tax=Falsiroseomonas selenitidurans TaxID=2716335 RepID=A0ABX1DZ45_9PROT|nr:GldG family protein [Falsiroseomonas selenitidurans]NKC30146.1 GldG family protein [Falsiroseomonas selenitidurans]
MGTTTTLATPRGKRGFSALVALLLAAILAVGVNMLADRLLSRARIDLTENRLYTLSAGTRTVLQGLADPITLRVFYSRRLGAAIPLYGAYAERVRAMLEEYAAVSGGKVRLEFYDPEPFSETEDRAMALGIQGVPVDQSGEQVYFGLAGVNLLDDERTIPFFQPDRERFLEYDLTRLVWELSNPTRPVLGVISSLPLNGDPRAMMMRQPGVGQPFVVMNQLRNFYTVRDIAADAQVIAPDVQVLLVAHAQNLPETMLYAIDQFVMRGGRLIALTDPHSESQASRPSPGQPPASDTSSSLPRLFQAWGIEAPSDKVVLDLRGAWRVRADPRDRVQAVDYVAWYNVPQEGLNRSEIATAELQQVTVASAGTVRAREGAALEFTPLVTSSTRSMLAEAAAVRTEPSPTRLLAAFQPDGQTHVIVARLRGVLSSAFEGPPPVPEGAERPADFPAHRARTEGPANLVVGNDSDILEDRFWVRTQDFFGQQVATPISDNGAFLINLADSMAGGEALVSLRSRGESLRPFALVEDIRRDAEAQFRQTERGLTERLEATERRLRELRQGGGQGGAAANTVITPEQRAEIDAARAEIVRTRGQLRQVQLELRRDIERLETWLRIANIAAVPLLLTVFAIGLGVFRARRRAGARA